MQTNRAVRAIVLGLLLAGCDASGPSTPPPMASAQAYSAARASAFPVVIGAAARGSQIKPCTDYASPWDYMGRPYRAYLPSNNQFITRHEGMDFCAPIGTPVIAGTNGKIHEIEADHEYRGGSLVLSTDIRAIEIGAPRERERRIYLSYQHIVPNPNLVSQQEVKAGDVLGSVQTPGKLWIGPVAHVHFAAGYCSKVYECHTDPNRFWANGPGKVTCFDAGKPPPAGMIVAPIRC